MTTETVSEIQDRNAAARGRVIEKATDSSGGWTDGDRDQAAGAVQAAMMELAAIWREDAAWFTEQKRKGHVTTSKELTQAAARLAGFAVGLTTRAVISVSDYDQRITDADGNVRDGRGTILELGPALADRVARQQAPLPHESQCDCGRPECAALSLATEIPNEPSLAMEAGCQHPDAQRSTLKSGVIMCTLCQSVVGQVEQLSEIVPGSKPGPVITGDPTMDYLTGAVSTYEPRTGGWVAGPTDEERRQAISDILYDPNVGADLMKSSPAVDNPFTSPGAPGATRAPVKRLTYGELGPLIAATYPYPRPHLSHSYVEGLAKCSLSALLSDASKGGHVGPRRPSWSLIGGNAFHAAVEAIERVALSLSGADLTQSMSPDWEAFWVEALDLQVAQLTESLTGTPYAAPSSWHVANKGLEGYDWWRVQGLDMIKRYLALHDTAWRNHHTLLQVPTDPTAQTSSPRVPVLELPFSVSAGSTAITAEGFIDAAWLCTGPEYPTATLEVVDYKSGKSLPSDHFQLVEYADVLRKHLPTNFALPVMGRFYRARLGTYTPAILLPAQPGQAEIDYRYTTAQRQMQHAAFLPHVDNMCSSCGSVDLCPAQAMRDGASS